MADTRFRRTAKYPMVNTTSHGSPAKRGHPHSSRKPVVITIAAITEAV